MPRQKMIDLSDVVGVYPICNTGAVLVHRIDYTEDRVLASLNGETPEWCSLKEEYNEDTQDVEPGFYLGSIFVPLIEVQRFYGGNG